MSAEFRPATLAAHTRMFYDFLAFLILAGLWMPQVSTLEVLAFVEYLFQAGISPSNITNYITAIRSMLILNGCNTAPFQDQRIPLFVKAIKINRPLDPVFHLTLDHVLLQKIVTAFDQFLHSILFKALYTFAFFSQIVQYASSHHEEI